MTVNKEMLIGEMIYMDEGIAPLLMASGMHCLGCAASQSETLEEAAFVHGIDCDALVDMINDYLSLKAK